MARSYKNFNRILCLCCLPLILEGSAFVEELETRLSLSISQEYKETGKQTMLGDEKRGKRPNSKTENLIWNNSTLSINEGLSAKSKEPRMAHPCPPTVLAVMLSSSAAQHASMRFSPVIGDLHRSRKKQADDTGRVV